MKSSTTLHKLDPWRFSDIRVKLIQERSHRESPVLLEDISSQSRCFFSPQLSECFSTYLSNRPNAGGGEGPVSSYLVFKGVTFDPRGAGEVLSRGAGRVSSVFAPPALATITTTLISESGPPEGPRSQEESPSHSQLAAGGQTAGRQVQNSSGFSRPL